MLFLDYVNFAKPYFLLMLISIPFIFIIIKNLKIGFFIIMFWIFFADWPMQLNIIPTQLTWLPEIILFIYLTILFFKKQLFNFTSITYPILIFIIIGIISAIINNKNFIPVMLCFRLDLKFIIMFYCLLQFQFSEKFYNFMLKWFFIFLIIQFPVSIYKYFIYGQGEFAIGTYGAWGGTLSLFLPLIGISFCFSFWLFKKLKLLHFFLLILCCIIFSIIGGKKGLIYYGPLLMLFFLYKCIFTLHLKNYLLKYIPIIMFVFIMFIPIIYTIKSFKPAINNPLYLKDFINLYDQRYSVHGDPAGRIPSIVATYNLLSNNKIKYFLGYGPGSTLKSYFKQYDTWEKHERPLWIEYGMTELVQKPLEYGYPAFFIYFIIPIIILYRDNEKLFKNLKNKDVYIRAISFAYSGILFTFLLIGISYNAIMRSDIPAFIFWFFGASIYAFNRSQEKSRVYE